MLVKVRYSVSLALCSHYSKYANTLILTLYSQSDDFTGSLASRISRLTGVAASFSSCHLL